MGAEMLGSRMLAPYFGSDIYVWANLIGTFLLAVALGNYLGGKLSLKKFILFFVSFLSVLMLLYVALSYKWLFKWISFGFKLSATEAGDLIEYTGNTPNAGKYGEMFKSLSACVIVFFPLIFLLSMISPIIIKRLSMNVEITGKVSGRVYAISTVGNLFGTFFTTFYLIVNFKTTEIFYIFFVVFIINLILIILFRMDATDEK